MYAKKTDLRTLNRQEEHRRIWAATRAVLERDSYKHKRYGKRSRSHWTLFERIILAFGFALKVVKLYPRGYRNAMNIAVNDIDIHSDLLPPAFDGYSILHLTDLHLDGDESIEHIVCERIRNLHYDLCVLTGDYRERTHGTFKAMVDPMRRIASAIRAKDGILAVLGNHDSYLMVDCLEDMGIRVLANETTTIQRQNSRIAITGIDDPNYYYTDQAIRGLEVAGKGFKIVLVHTPELFDVAADNGYSLYLCGHTHGGQICLPGGIPLITHLYHGRKFHNGWWRYNDMQGYTGQGTGTVALPVRFNSQSEIARITLRRSGLGHGKRNERLAVLPKPR
jgi:predicted MPP superfamily phosphohydrolase